MQRGLLLIVFAFLAFGKAVIAQVGTPSENDYTYQLIAAADQRLETQPSLALLYIDSALVRSYELEDRQAEAYCYLTLGKIQTKLRRFPIASDHLDQASSLFAKVRDEEGVYQTQRAQARLLMAMRRWAEAKGAWQTFREAAQTKTRWQDIATAETQLAQIALNQDAFAEALPHFSNALELNRDNNEPDGVIAAYNSLSATCNTMGDTVMGNLYSLQAGQFALENGFFSPPETRGFTDASSTDQFQYQADTKFGKKNDFRQKAPQQLELSEVLANNYEIQGNFDSALVKYKAARSIEKNILEDRITTLEAALETNAELNQQLELVNLRVKGRQNALRRQKLISLGLGMMILILLGSGLVVLRTYRSRQRAHQQLALKSLRSQMNPHFIFNSLNSVNSYIAKNDPRAANKYLSDFSKLMRGVLENSEQEFIPLQTEVQILKLYLGLEHLRFQDRFEYQFTVAPELELDSIFIPPMLVQPYIENAVWHGLRYKKDKGQLQVAMFQKDEALIIEICDDGIGRKRSAELKTHNQSQQNSTGLKNTSARLDLINTLYNQQLEINIEDLDPTAEDVGTRVEIKLSLRENQQHV